MKKRALRLVLILPLISSIIAGTGLVQLVRANFFPGDALIIYSPTSTEVYTKTSVSLNIVASVANPAPEIVSITYCFNEDPNVTLTDLNKTLRQPGHIDGSQFYIELTLENLSEGNHTMSAYSEDASGKQMSASVEFIIDTSFTSPLSVLSPQNRTYTTNEIPLVFVCTEEIRRTEDFLMADYLLDGIGAGYIPGNITLTDLSTGQHGFTAGQHELTVIVWTVKGVFSETVNFSIIVTSEPTPSPPPSPASTNSPEPTLTPELPSKALIIAVVVLVAIGTIALIVIVTAGLIVYYKKSRKGKTQ